MTETIGRNNRRKEENVEKSLSEIIVGKRKCLKCQQKE